MRGEELPECSVEQPSVNIQAEITHSLTVIAHNDVSIPSLSQYCPNKCQFYETPRIFDVEKEYF